MSWLIYLFGSGWAFFVGAGFVLVATQLLPRARGGWRASLVSIVALVGLVVLGLSAVPLSYWLYAASVAIRNASRKPVPPSAAKFITCVSSLR